MGLKQLVNDFCSGMRIGMEHIQFREFFEKDRDAAVNDIANIVQHSTPEELTEFERALVTHGVSVVGPAHRLRAMELYAILKIQETLHYKAFRGFLGESGPLA